MKGLSVIKLHLENYRFSDHHSLPPLFRKEENKGACVCSSHRKPHTAGAPEICKLVQACSEIVYVFHPAEKQPKVTEA